MQALEFWKAITMDQANVLERLFHLLDDHAIRYCLVDGPAVNAYAEPLVSLDLDLAVAAEQLEDLETLLAQSFKVQRFPHSLNLSAAGSDLRVQFQTDPRYAEFVERATQREVLGLTLPVAAVEDVLRGKVWAAQGPERRGSKRLKDLTDIARLVETYPELRAQVPEAILARVRAD